MHAARSHSEAGVSSAATAASASHARDAKGAAATAATAKSSAGASSAPNGACTAPAAATSGPGASATTLAAPPAVIPFPFPFPPYPQQYALMSHIFHTLQQGQGHVCIVESPTGTGKSLSLISSCLYWLLEHHPREQAEAAAAAAAAANQTSVGGTPGWVIAQHAELQAAAARKRDADAQLLQASITKQLQKRAEEEAAQRKRDAQTAARLGANGAAAAAAAGDPDADLLPTDAPTAASSLSFAQQLELDDLQEKQADADKLLRELVLAPDVPQSRKAQLILERQARAARIAALTGGGTRASDAQVDELGAMLSRMLSGDRPRRKPQLIYASRTHSQLIQFVNEIKKTKYGQRLQVRPNVIAPNAHATKQPAKGSTAAVVPLPATPAAASTPAPVLSIHELSNAPDPRLVAKVISLGSRANLCVNPLLSHLRAQPLQLNEVCVDMQKNKPDPAALKSVAISIDKNNLPTRAALTAAACPYLDPSSLELFHTATLSRVYDLEELPALGAQLHFCSYYGSRNASPEADVIVVPYASLLSATTRAALNIDLAGAVVVVDEAHNLHDAINQLHSCVLTHAQLRRTLHALKLYRARFEKKLRPENLQLLADLIALCEGFMLAMLRANIAARQQRDREDAQGSGGGSNGDPVRQLDDFIGSGIDRDVPIATSAAGAGTPASGEQASTAPRSSGLPPSVQRSLTSSTSTSTAAPSFRNGSGGSGGGGRVTYTLIKRPNSFLASLHISHINPRRVEAWVERQRMVHKIKGYLDRYHSAEGEEFAGAGGGGPGGGVVLHGRARKDAVMGAVPDSEYESSSLSPLAPVIELIKALNNADSDGRICIDVVLDSGASGSSPAMVHPKSSLRFLMLNPSVHVEPLLKHARTLVLAGGTMRPFDALLTSLFPVLSVQHPGRIHEFSCGHVVPPEHIQALIVRSGPVPTPGTGAGGVGVGAAAGAEQPVEFCFTHARRQDRAQHDALALTILNMLPLVPGGMVLFLTSYAFEAELVEYWSTHADRHTRLYPSAEAAAAAGAAAAAAAVAAAEENGNSAAQSTPPPPRHPQTWLEKMRARKCLFREPRAAAGVDHVLNNYTRVIEEAQAVAAGAIVAGTRAPCAQQAPPPPPQPPQPAQAAQAKLPSRSLSSAHMQDDRYRLEAEAAARAALAQSDSNGSGGGASSVSFTDHSLRRGQNGALLFAVIGGKLSEGINFSDGLARCVAVVGLPYPNRHEAATKEKVAFLDARERDLAATAAAAAAASAAAATAAAATAVRESKEGAEMEVEPANPTSAAASSSAPSSSAPVRAPSAPSVPGRNSSAGSRYLHTLCMRAVNQSIGRAIRHRGDYASILLLDSRYAGADVVAGLPAWITGGPSFKPQGVPFAQARAAVSAFFAFHKNRARKAASSAANSGCSGSAAAPAPPPVAPPSAPTSGAAPHPPAPSAPLASPSDLQRKRKPDEPPANEQRPAKFSAAAGYSNALA